MIKRLLMRLRSTMPDILSFLSGSDHNTSSKPYSVQYTFTNMAGVTVKFRGMDKRAEKSSGLREVASGPSDVSSTSSFYVSTPSTDIRITLYDLTGAELTHVDVSGVPIGRNKISYIYMTYDGSKLNVDATRPAGVR